MLAMLKILNVRSVVVHTEWRITGFWLGDIRLIPSLILLEKPLL